MSPYIALLTLSCCAVHVRPIVKVGPAYFSPRTTLKVVPQLDMIPLTSTAYGMEQRSSSVSV